MAGAISGLAQSAFAHSLADSIDPLVSGRIIHQRFAGTRPTASDGRGDLVAQITIPVLGIEHNSSKRQRVVAGLAVGIIRRFLAPCHNADAPR